jgi:hypothetical protein
VITSTCYGHSLVGRRFQSAWAKPTGKPLLRARSPCWAGATRVPALTDGPLVPLAADKLILRAGAARRSASMTLPPSSAYLAMTNLLSSLTRRMRTGTFVR